jgi:hypothetical protein
MPRRKFDIFSMSFLDTICCAFGSVVLLYMIINAASGRQFQKDTSGLQAEVDRLEQEVLEGYQQLAAAKNSLDETLEESKRTEGLSARILAQTEKTKEELADADGQTISRREAIERLKADLKSLEEGRKRLEGGSNDAGSPGTRVRGFVGQGDRQYLTGLKVSGDRILILVDASASMLDETVVNVIRMRNMSDTRKLLSDKWRRAVSTVEWVAAQLPSEGRFQILAFNTKTWALVPGSDGKWLQSNDPNALGDALKELRKLVPAEGTSLENAFISVAGMNPRPDNVILVTDGLPTQGTSAPLIRKTVDGDARAKLFEKAFNKYPQAVPLNTILMPMEGDPAAPNAYWQAARATRGSFMMPSRDWP